jgi:hypothetical protein
MSIFGDRLIVSGNFFDGGSPVEDRRLNRPVGGFSSR